MALERDDAYSILFSTEAWRATGSLSREQFGRLNRLLGSFAAAAGLVDARTRLTEHRRAGLGVLEVSGVRASYSFDHTDRVLHVVELTCEAPVDSTAAVR